MNERRSSSCEAMKTAHLPSTSTEPDTAARPSRSTSRVTARRGTPASSRSPSTLTEAMRWPLQDSRATGRQMPEVTRVGPQSQPKLQAALRMKAYGSAYAPGRSPSLSRSASA
nr:hypothetical protein [Streptomyces sp. BpilaLS-43]